MRVFPALLLFAFCAPAVAGWLEKVAPVITPEERKLYLSLTDPAAREKFEEGFWQTKRITADEFESRLAYVQSAYGSVHSDRGRMYLSLGAPVKVSRLASTRSFWPLEIWYYDTAPAIGVSSAVQFLFFQCNGVGDYRIYSPSLDTFANLLNPQSGTRGMFRQNDMITEADIRNNMRLSPAEDEIVEAAIGVARGIKGVGNDEIIARATSPEAALSKTTRYQVSSRLITAPARPVLTVFQSWSDDGVPVVDLSLETQLKSRIGLSVSTEESETKVSFNGRKVRYQHRLFLLPGSYTVTFSVDGLTYPFPLEVTAKREASALLLGRSGVDKPGTPFEFGPVHLEPTVDGPLAIAQLTSRQTVKWRLRQNASVVWSAETEPLAGNVAMTAFHAPPGRYTLEMRAGGEMREREVEIGAENESLPVISYNANLSSDQRARSIGRQWLARGRLVEARTWLDRAREIRPSDAVAIDLCRVSALAGDMDSPREKLKEILAREPDNFEALSLFGYIEAKLQDYAVAAQYYRKALAVRHSPVIAEALARVSDLSASTPAPRKP